MVQSTKTLKWTLTCIFVIKIWIITSLLHMHVLYIDGKLKERSFRKSYAWVPQGYFVI